MTIESILIEREKAYGDFSQVAQVYSGIKEALAIDTYNNVDARFKAALDMIAMKMARVVCGNPNHKDTWDDIAGYATLISKELNI